MNDEKLQHGYDILNGAPWRSRDDLIETLIYLRDFHKDLVDKHFSSESADALANEITSFLQENLNKDLDFKNSLMNFHNLTPDQKKSVIRGMYKIMSGFCVPELQSIPIYFVDKNTRVNANTNMEKLCVTYFNVGNPMSMLLNAGALICNIAHEYTHLLQAVGKSTIPKEVNDLAGKYYVSFAFLEHLGDKEVSDLSAQCWRNHIGEKEAIHVGGLVEKNITNYNLMDA